MDRPTVSDEQIVWTSEQAWKAVAGAIIDGLPAASSIHVYAHCALQVHLNALPDMQPWLDYFGLSDPVTSSPYGRPGRMQRHTARRGPWRCGWEAEVSFIEEVPDPPPAARDVPAGLGVLDELAAGDDEPAPHRTES